MFVDGWVNGLAGGLSNSKHVSEGAETAVLVRGHGWFALFVDAAKDAIGGAFVTAEDVFWQTEEEGKWFVVESVGSW